MLGTLEREVLVGESRSVFVPLGLACMEGTLELPPGATGVVFVVHDSVGSRASPEYHELTTGLRAHGVGTFLVDLLISEEERAEYVGRTVLFQIERLTFRVRAAMRAVQAELRNELAPLGCLGIGSGAAAAVVAAAREPVAVRAVATWGGRPGDSGEALFDLAAPTLFVVAAEEDEGTQTESARARFPHGHRWKTVPADALGAFERAADITGDWFAHQWPGTSIGEPTSAAVASGGTTAT